MRTLILTGRLAANAEIKMTKNGNQYLEFRMANNEFGDEEGRTYWFRVTSFNSNHVNLAQYLTKGKSIEVIGDLRTSTYVNNSTGKVEISHDIRAVDVRFDNNFSLRQDGANQQYTASEKSQSNVMRNPSTKPMVQQPKQVATPTAAPIVNNSDDDDLPF